MKRILAIIFVVIISGCVQGNYIATGEKVSLVIDGDTIILDSGKTVRLIGINAPEKYKHCYNEAKEKLEELVLDKEVRMEKDESKVDRFGRLLRYVYTDEFVNLEMVKSGYAYAVQYKPNVKFTKELEDAERYAKENKLGCLFR